MPIKIILIVAEEALLYRPTGFQYFRAVPAGALFVSRAGGQTPAPRCSASPGFLSTSAHRIRSKIKRGRQENHGAIFSQRPLRHRSHPRVVILGRLHAREQSLAPLLEKILYHLVAQTQVEHIEINFRSSFR